MGWVEGQNIAFESRSADGKGDALPKIAAAGDHPLPAFASVTPAA
jgi:hypothetical protein